MPNKRNHRYNDTQLYVSTVRFLKIYGTILTNLRIDYKHAYGFKLAKNIEDLCLAFSLSYAAVELTEKLKYSDKAISLIKIIEIELQILYDISVITKKQYTTMSLEFGNIIIQSNGWHESLKRIYIRKQESPAEKSR